MTSWLSYPCIGAANCGPARTRAPANLIVIHTIESPERPGTARGTAEWFAGKRGPAPRASAHFCIGQDEVIQCVALDVVSWAAPGVNSRAINLEHEGRASQTIEQWDDSTSRAVLTRSARVAAEVIRALDIPFVRVGPEDLRLGAGGICSHDAVSKAFPDKGHGHYDPGKNFPWSGYFERIGDELKKLGQAAPETIAPKLDPATLPVLREGATGEHVVLLQERLRYWGRPVKADGDFGAMTGAAVADFQRARALKGDRVVGSITWAALLKDMG